MDFGWWREEMVDFGGFGEKAYSVNEAILIGRT